jgi:hypothetical protein
MTTTSYNNDLFDITEESDAVIKSISDNNNNIDDDKTNANAIQELHQIVSYLREDFNVFMNELVDLRKIVYKNVQHLSERSIGDYAEIYFVVSKKFIRRNGIYIFMSDLMQSCVSQLTDNHVVKMIPSIKNHKGMNLISLLCLSSCNINYSLVASRLAEFFHIDDEVTIYVEKQENALKTFDICKNSFQVNFLKYIDEINECYFEINQFGNCVIQHNSMQLNVLNNKN